MKGLICATLTAIAVSPVVAIADTEASPDEYTKLVQNKKYIFVMLAPPKWRSYATLHKKYKKSGLYRNNGSRAPLWTVDWYEFAVDVASDGQHLIRWGSGLRSPEARNNPESYSTLAVAFYKNGREMKRYRVRDLITNPSGLPHSESHYKWLKDSRFDDKQKRLTVLTYAGGYSNGSLFSSGKRYVFDVTSGQIISGKLPHKGQTATR